MKKPITYSNYLNTVGLKDFNESELNLFFFLLKELNYQGDDEITLPYKYISKELNSNGLRSDRLTKLLKSMLGKLIKITFIREGITDKGKLKYYEYTIFNKYSIDEEKKIITIRATKDAIPLLNDLLKEFTKIDFAIYLELKTKYSKELYRHLRQYNTTRLWRVSIENFSDFLLIPSSYDSTKIIARIIKPSIEELKKYYPDLRVNYFYEHSGKKGRPKIKTVEFVYFKEEEQKQVDFETGEIIEKEDLSINLSLEKKKELLLKLQQEILLEENKENFPEWVTEDTKKILNRTYSRE